MRVTVRTRQVVPATARRIVEWGRWTRRREKRNRKRGLRGGGGGAGGGGDGKGQRLVEFVWGHCVLRYRRLTTIKYKIHVDFLTNKINMNIDLTE